MSVPAPQYQAGASPGFSGDVGKPRFIAGVEPLSVQAGLKKEISLTFVKQRLGFSAMSLGGRKQVHLVDSCLGWCVYACVYTWMYTQACVSLLLNLHSWT